MRFGARNLLLWTCVTVLGISSTFTVGPTAGAVIIRDVQPDIVATVPEAPQIRARSPFDDFNRPQQEAAGHYVYLPLIVGGRQPSSGRIGPVVKLSSTTGRYQKFEVAFDVSTDADNVYFPYDPDAPAGERGVSVDMLTTSPAGKTKTVPCFYYQPVDSDLVPVGSADWRCRFAPDAVGVWQYLIRVTDDLGAEETTPDTFHVTPSSDHGFVRVSATDSHYFEFSDGTPFLSPLINVEYGNALNSLDQIRTNIPAWGQNGLRFVRWFPTGESANYYVIPFGDDIKSSWGFGPAYTQPDGDPSTGQKFTFEPYYYTGQTVPAVPGSRYRLSFRAKVTGDKIFRPQLGQAILSIRASDWRDYSIETTSTGDTLSVELHDGYSEGDNTSGTIRVYAIRLQRDGTGHGGWGPNLLSRGDPDTFKYVDQIGAARLDEIMRLSEQYGVCHKLTLFQKNDAVLGSLAADGSATSDWDINNFYSGEGQTVRRYEKAYARYFVARWSYSTALHSIELANENMLTQESYDAAFSILGYIRSISPRPILLSNSFWGYFVEDFWADPTNGNVLDYADKHWYARPGSNDEELVSTVTRDSAANVRECQKRFMDYELQYHVNKPIVRGETGVWQTDGYDPMDLGSGVSTYFHKQVWAQMGDQCGGEWYADALTQGNLLGMYALYEQFLQGVPLTNGRYTPVGTDLGNISLDNTSGAVRAWGKIDFVDGQGILWVDNADDTWWHTAQQMPIGMAGGVLTIAELPDGTYDVTRYDPYSGTASVGLQTTAAGKLSLTVSDLQHDIALKFKKR